MSWISGKEEQHDILVLVVGFLSAVSSGQDASLETFKEEWKKLKFSYIFTGCARNRKYENFVQLLYDESLKVASRGLYRKEVGVLLQDVCRGFLVEYETMCRYFSDEYRYVLYACSVYCLFCLYYTQPREITIKIRVKEEFFYLLRDIIAGCSREEVHIDARNAFQQLLKADAFVLGAKSQIVSMKSSEFHGTGSLALTPGLHGEDAATLRESKFHLDSTLLGLGTRKLDEACSWYKSKLLDLLDIDEPEHAHGVADLGFGREIHRCASLSAEKIQMILQDNVRKRKKSSKIMAQKQTMSKSRNKKNIHHRVGGLPSGAHAVLARETERTKDIAARRRRLEQRLGINAQGDELEVQNAWSKSGSEDEDMPNLFDEAAYVPGNVSDSFSTSENDE